MSEKILKIENVVKEYRLGQYNSGSLQGDLKSWWARIRHKEDPNSKIGEDVTKRTFRALDGVSFEVNQGERVGIIGHNGAGKSTVLKLISRVTGPTEGKIWLNGRVASMLEVGTGFHPELTGRENVYLNGAILGMTKKEVSKKFDEIVAFSEIEKFIDTPVKRYSSGMYVKLAFSVAAHLDSEIVIMDEVLAVGDMKFQNKCLQKMNKVSKEEGRTILYVSHNMNTIRQLCARCVVLDHGKVQYEGAVEHAIGIYMNQDGDVIKPDYELDSASRPSPNHGRRTRITHFCFLDTQDCIFDPRRPLRFCIRWDSHEDIEGIRIRFEFHAMDGSPVAMCESDVLCNAKDGCSYSHEGELDISSFAPGEYYFRIDMYNSNEYGGAVSYDHPEKNIFFMVQESGENQIVWHTNYWGYMRLSNIRVKEISS